MVFGGPQFQLTNIFAFAKELGETLQKEVDVYEIHEVNEGSGFEKIPKFKEQVHELLSDVQN